MACVEQMDGEHEIALRWGYYSAGLIDEDVHWQMDEYTYKRRLSKDWCVGLVWQRQTKDVGMHKDATELVTMRTSVW